MAFLLEHLPPQLHLVVATRADPPLPLARLRARGELAEVRAADLRFTEQETAAYFDGMGLRLYAGDVAALEDRTEGWIAALQLAALSLRGRDDAAGFIEGFAGDDRYVVDYLVEEVVHRQPEDVREFLLRTSILTGCPVPWRRGHRSDRRPRDARDARPRQPVPGRRSTTAVAGTATTICSPTCCAHVSSTSSPSGCPSCTAGPVRGTSRPATRRSRSSTRSLPATLERAAGLVELPSRRWARSGARPSSGAGWRRSPTRSFASRPVLANGYVGALMSTGEVRGVEPRLRIAEKLGGGGASRTCGDAPGRTARRAARAIPQASRGGSRSTARAWP